MLNIAVKELKDKKIGTLHLSSCNNGNLDWINKGNFGGREFTQNMAITFLKEMPEIKTVKAWDGYAMYLDMGLGVIEDSSRYSTIEEFFYKQTDFDKYSKAKNGYRREATGLITYKRENGRIIFSPDYKYYYGNIQGLIGRYPIYKKIMEVIR